MERQHGYQRFWTIRFDDREQGCSGFRLHRESRGETTVVAVVTFWDAAGQFFIETLGSEIPVVVAEDLIREAREQIKTK
jgi:hypothetical protein